MDKHTQHLIDELLEIDPLLGEREGFSRVVETMARVKPKVRLRDDFQKELRGEIMSQSKLLAPGNSWTRLGTTTVRRWVSWKNLSYFSTGLAFAAFAIFAFRQLDFLPTTQESSSSTLSKMQAPALGGATNRALPESSAPTTANDDMAAVRNISPKNPKQTPATTQENRMRDVAPQAPKLESQPDALAQKSAPNEPSITALTAPAPTDAGTTSDTSLMYGGAPTSSSPMMAKIAPSAVRFAFSGEIPAVDPMQSVTISAS